MTIRELTGADRNKRLIANSIANPGRFVRELANILTIFTNIGLGDSAVKVMPRHHKAKSNHRRLEVDLP